MFSCFVLFIAGFVQFIFVGFFVFHFFFGNI